MHRPFALVGLSLVVGFCIRAVAEPPAGGLIGHWPLAFEAKDVSGQKLDGQASGVKFETPLSAEGPKASALFDGRVSRIAVADTPSLQLGKGDFTAALWVRTDELLDDDLGDLLSKFDPVRRRGFTLTLRNNFVTSSQSNYRQLQFGIDAGSEPQWTDLGRPGKALLAFSLCVHEGQLYCGTCEPGQDESGHVYHYEGEQAWKDLGAPDKSNSVIAMAAFRGQLYVGTGKYRLGGSALAESENPHFGGGIFRYEEGRWHQVGQLPEVEATASLAVYQGRLYASSLYKPASFFRYEEDGNWTSLPTPGGKRVESLAVHNGYLWATGYDEGNIYRFDGQTWQDLGRVGENTQTYSFAMQGGRLHVGTWPSGKVFYFGDGSADWHDAGRLGEELEVMGMALHNGKLYAGSLPLAEMFRNDGEGKWNSVGRIDLTPEVKYRRIWTCAQYQGRLLASTLPSGHVHALTAGPCVTHDHELPPGWQHVAAVRDGGRLLLYVGGKQVAQSAAFQPGEFDLTNDQPLVIGNGPGDAFYGRLRDLRLYSRALSPIEIAVLAVE